MDKKIFDCVSEYWRVYARAYGKLSGEDVSEDLAEIATRYTEDCDDPELLNDMASLLVDSLNYLKSKHDREGRV